jgi:hypothetical protein
LNTDTAAARARTGRDALRWQGANPSEAEGLRALSQGRQRDAAGLDRVCSALTQEVILVVVAGE